MEAEALAVAREMADLLAELVASDVLPPEPGSPGKAAAELVERWREAWS